MERTVQTAGPAIAYPYPTVLAALLILAVTTWTAYQVIRRCLRGSRLPAGRGAVLPMALLSLTGFTALFISVWGMGRLREPLIIHLVIQYPLELFLGILGLTLYCFAEGRIGYRQTLRSPGENSTPSCPACGQHREN